MRPFVILLMSVSAPLAAQEAATFEQSSAALEAEIARTGKIDVKYPGYLAAQLDYAQLLSRNTSAEDCATRLPAAESHFAIARDSLVAPLVLQAARGRIPVVGYYLEMARSRCTGDAQKTAALQAALKYARDAVEGYRAIFMYEPMTIMQFNVAQTWHDLGDQAGALKELQAAIDLDRTFGFKADAEENFRTLNQWQDKELSAADASAFAESFVSRSVTLAFAWKPAKVDVSASFDNAAFEGGAVRHTKFNMPMTGVIKAEGDNLVYETKIGEPKIEASTLGSELEKKLVGLMARILGRLPVAEISKTGEFQKAREVEQFAQVMNAEIDKAITQAVPEKDPRHPAIKAAIEQELRPFATVENLTGKIQQGYALETGIWSGATLEQNGWVSMPLTLSMNGTPQGFIEHTVEAAFSRRLPCAPGLPADGCVELLIEAVPTDKAIADVAQKLQDGEQGRLDYAAATRVRVVVDPATLVPYENETLRYTYLALANKGQRAVKISTDRSLATYKYRK